VVGQNPAGGTEVDVGSTVLVLIAGRELDGGNGPGRPGRPFDRRLLEPSRILEPEQPLTPIDVTGPIDPFRRFGRPS
jgi:hypothetical protein